MAGKLISGIAHEVRHMLPPTIFFMVCFNVLVLTLDTLSPEARGISHSSATVGALLIGKAVLLAEMLPFLHRYAHRPLIFGTVWKAFVLYLVTSALHLLERVISARIDAGSLAAGLSANAAAFNWSHFWIVQMWLAILFLVYVGFQDLVRAVGADRVRTLFFRNGAAIAPGPRATGAPLSGAE